jgi:glycosyltransferase involved in cell wall biosynthesis
VGVIVHLCTSDRFVHFLDAPLREQARAGFEVHLATRVGHLGRSLAKSGLVTVHELPLTRRMAPAEDAWSLARTLALLRQLRPELVHAHNPKAGLIGMMAARLAGVPRRVYTVHGLPHVTAGGARRAVLLASEAIACRLAQRVLPVSASVQAELLLAGLIPRSALRLIGAGSADGVDTARFCPDPAAGRALRRRLGIPVKAPVLLFVGRLHREKGLPDLVDAFGRIQRDLPDVELLIVGERDPTDPVPDTGLRGRARVHFLGEMSDPRTAFAAATLHVLPTLREGLPTVALEAAAMELPTVAYDSLGVRDAVRDGMTGVLIAPRDVRALAEACLALLRSQERCRQLGLRGRSWVSEHFEPVAVRAGVLAVYAELGLVPPAGRPR